MRPLSCTGGERIPSITGGREREGSDSDHNGIIHNSTIDISMHIIDRYIISIDLYDNIYDDSDHASPAQRTRCTEYRSYYELCFGPGFTCWHLQSEVSSEVGADQTSLL